MIFRSLRNAQIFLGTQGQSLPLILYLRQFYDKKILQYDTVIRLETEDFINGSLHFL